jgi:bifunctional non-homologous end joining protein LigD
MLATLTRELPADAGSWAAEMKWDGMRAIAYLSDRGDLRLRSRSGRDITACYPELGELAAGAGGRQMILDGEIVAFTGGLPSFADLQRRMQVRHPGPQLVSAVPVSYLVFDVMYLDGQPLLRVAYSQRRGLLERLGLQRGGASVDVPPSFPGAGRDALAASGQLGLEGIVLKRLESPYVQRRSRLWLKVKQPRSQLAVIGGWTPGRGYRAPLIGSLLLGVQGPPGLEYCGQVGTGFTDAALRDLARRLRAIERPDSPFAAAVPTAQARHAHWVLPVLVGEVSYAEWTPGGRLRHPVWQGLRPGHDPASIRRSPLATPI